MEGELEKSARSATSMKSLSESPYTPAEATTKQDPKTSPVAPVETNKMESKNDENLKEAKGPSLVTRSSTTPVTRSSTTPLNLPRASTKYRMRSDHYQTARSRTSQLQQLNLPQSLTNNRNRWSKQQSRRRQQFQRKPKRKIGFDKCSVDSSFRTKVGFQG